MQRSVTTGTRPRDRRLRYASWITALVAMTLGENRVFDRLLFLERSEVDFVLRNVHGVINGTPAFRSFQHRILAPMLLRSMEGIAESPLDALEHFFHLMVFAINFILFYLLRRKGASYRSAVLGVGAFGFARILLTYRLEYPWDELDLLLFAVFGFAVSQRRSLWSIGPLLLAGIVNHETVLYIPLWYIIAALVRSKKEPSANPLRDLSLSTAVAASMAGIIVWMRYAMYVEPSGATGSIPETGESILNNQFHLAHNIGQFFVSNWTGGRPFVSIGLLSALVALMVCRQRGEHIVACWWSLAVIVTIFLFGYVNETRLYLCLLAFWSVYAWPTSAQTDGAGGSQVDLTCRTQPSG